MFNLVDETNEILNTPIAEVPFQDIEEPAQLINNMFDFMYSKNGIGLAAPQIGLQIPVFVMGFSGEQVSCFNPKILSFSKEKITIKEGCLSYPNLNINVIRSKEIVVEYQNEYGKLINTTFSSWFARIFQHELDHLHGITFLKRSSKLGLKIALQKRRAML